MASPGGAKGVARSARAGMLVLLVSGLACQPASGPLERQSLESAFVAIAESGDLALVERFLRSEPSLIGAHARRDSSYEPTHALPAAARAGKPEIVRLLLERGVPVDTSGFGIAGERQPTALAEAAEQGHIEIVQLLLEHGAAVLAQDRYGATALHRAAQRGRSDVVALLLARGANVNLADQQGQSPLHLVASSWKLPALVALCAAGAKSDQRDQQGHTPLQIAEAQWTSERQRPDAGRDWVAAGGNTVAFLKSGRCEELAKRSAREGRPSPESLELLAYEFGCAQGDGESCSYAGRAYDDGKGVARDIDRARKLFEQGCGKGDAWGCSRQGWYYLAGQGVPRDEARGAQLYGKACEGGHAFACARLGEFYLRGQGVPRDPQKARELLKKACESSHKDEKACATLQRMTSGGTP